MGIKQFFSIKLSDKRTIADLGKIVKLSKYRNCRLCIDTSFVIHNAIKAMPSLKTMTDPEGNVTAHLKLIMLKIMQFAREGITQVWILDSPASNPLKVAERDRRLEAKKKLIERDGEDSVHNFSINADVIADVKTLISNMGVDYMEVPDGIEAEQYGAYLSSGKPEERFFQYMISGDSDVLVFGGNLLRVTSEKSKTVYVEYEINNILSELNMTQNQLIEMSVAMGTDFNKKIAGIGPATVVRKIKSDDIKFTSEQIQVIDYFKKVPEMEPNIVQGSFNKKAVLDFLEKKGFKKDLIQEQLNTYEKNINN